MNCKIKVKGSFMPGALVSDGQNVLGVVSECDEHEADVILVDLVRGLMKYRGLNITAVKATAEMWNRLIDEKPQFLHGLSLEEKIFHTVFVADTYGKESAEKLVKKILGTLVAENASHDAILEYARNVDFIFED